MNVENQKTRKRSKGFKPISHITQVIHVMPNARVLLCVGPVHMFFEWPLDKCILLSVTPMHPCISLGLIFESLVSYDIASRPYFLIIIIINIGWLPACIHKVIESRDPNFNSSHSLTASVSLLHSELVLVLAIQVHDLLTQSCLLHLLLEVVQRTQEDIVVTVFRTLASFLLPNGTETEAYS
jgi:hypothetical protein